MSRGDFWSRRKAAVEAEDIALDQQVVEQQTENEAAEKSDEDILEELGLPDPDTMEDGDDFSGFMNSAVPNRLRTKALRRLWKTNPVLANVDGLVDYGEDFTDAALVIENMQTAYQVGKGMTKHVLEMARQEEEAERLKNEVELAEEEPEEPDENPDSEIEETEMLAEDETPPDPPTATNVVQHAENTGKARRMRYSFENAPGEDV